MGKLLNLLSYLLTLILPSTPHLHVTSCSLLNLTLTNVYVSLRERGGKEGEGIRKPKVQRWKVRPREEKKKAGRRAFQCQN